MYRLGYFDRIRYGRIGLNEVRDDIGLYSRTC